MVKRNCINTTHLLIVTSDAGTCPYDARTCLSDVMTLNDDLEYSIDDELVDDLNDDLSDDLNNG